MKRLLTLGLLALFSTPFLGAQASDPVALLARIDDQRFVPDMNFTLTITAFQNTQVIEESTLWGWVRSSAQGSQALLAFVLPSASRGRKMLMDGPVVYLLFPKTRNPIRLSPLQVLVGQSSNGDVARTGFSQDYVPGSMTTETLDGNPSWVFTLEAKPDRQAVTYRRVTLWVDPETLRPRAADFFGTGDQRLKHAEYGDFRSVGGKIVPFRLDITDGADATKHTVLQYTQVGRQALPAGAFRRDYLETWTPEAPR